MRCPPQPTVKAAGPDRPIRLFGARVRRPIWKGAVKTTTEISDPLLRQARKLAASGGVALRMLVEPGLRGVVSETKPATQFKLRKASVKGKGLQADRRDASWDGLRDLAYEGRGG